MTTHVLVNGTETPVDDETSVQQIVERTLNGTDSVSGRGIAVAVNNDVVPRSSWPATRVHDGDRIEILTATQGG